MLEMNFARLLHHTEDLASADKAGEIRFASYLAALKQFFAELTVSPDRPTEDYVRHYQSRLKQLEVSREMALAANPEERAAFLILPTSPLVPRPVKDDCLSISVQSNGNVPSVPTDIKAGTMTQTTYVRGYLDQPPNIIRLEQQRVAKAEHDALLGPERHHEDRYDPDLSIENPQSQRQSRSQSVHNEVIRREKLASDMLHMAQHLKEQSSAIGERLQTDRQVLEASVSQADRNSADMSVVLNQLSEELGSRCARVVWVALLITLVVFFQMIAFMKLFRKRVRVVYNLDRTEL